MTGTDKFWGKPEYPRKGCGMGREATLFLTERGVKIMGIDSWGFDRPFDRMAKEFAETNNIRLTRHQSLQKMRKTYDGRRLPLLNPLHTKAFCLKNRLGCDRIMVG